MSVASEETDNKVIALDFQGGASDTLVGYYYDQLKTKRINKYQASYVDCGKGLPLIFLHGNFCTSFCWRAQVKGLSSSFRCVAPDMLGLGQSKRLAGDNLEQFDFQSQREFVSEFIENIVKESEVVLVVQGSGATLGCDWAYRNQDRVKAIVHLSGVFPNALDCGLQNDSAFARFKELTLALATEPGLLGTTINMAVLSPLCGEVLKGYTQPFDNPDSLAIAHYWMMSLAEREHAPEIYAQTVCNTSWIAKSSLPKLMVDSSVTLPQFQTFRNVARHFKNQQLTECDASYLVQEDLPEWLTLAIGNWVKGLDCS